jgi:hypothetical protein
MPRSISTSYNLVCVCLYASIFFYLFLSRLYLGEPPLVDTLEVHADGKHDRPQHRIANLTDNGSRYTADIDA